MKRNPALSLMIVFAVLLTGLVSQAKTVCTVGKSQIHPSSEDEFNVFRTRALDMLKDGGLINTVTVMAELGNMIGAFDAEGSTLTIDSASKPVEISFDLTLPDAEKLAEMSPEEIILSLKDYVSFKKLAEMYAKLPRTTDISMKTPCDTLAASGRGAVSYICKDVDDRNIYLAVSYSRTTKTGTVSMNNGPMRMFKNEISCK